MFIKYLNCLDGTLGFIIVVKAVEIPPQETNEFQLNCLGISWMVICFKPRDKIAAFPSLLPSKVIISPQASEFIVLIKDTQFIVQTVMQFCYLIIHF